MRGLEKQIRNIAEHRDKLAKQASRMNADNPERAEIEAEVMSSHNCVCEVGGSKCGAASTAVAIGSSVVLYHSLS